MRSPETSIRVERFVVKLPSGCAAAVAGTARVAEQHEEDQQPLHHAYLVASGAQTSEKCGLSASARRNDVRAATRRPRQRSAIPRWKSFVASRVPSRSARSEKRR